MIRAIAPLVGITLLALFVACLGVRDALAGEPGLKPPSAAAPPLTSPAPASPSAPVTPEEADTLQFFVVPAAAIERVGWVIEAQRREIERLRAIVDKGSCS